MGYLQVAADGVMIGDCNVIHATFTGGSVEMQRGGIAFRAVELAHGPVGWFIGMVGMDMKIGAICFHGYTHNRLMLQPC